MPNYFPEGDTPLQTDSLERSAVKVVSLLPEVLSSWSQLASPSDLPNLEVWLDAGAGLLVTISPRVEASNGQQVARWENRISNKHFNNDAFAYPGLGPVYKTDVNGRKAVYFNGGPLLATSFGSFPSKFSYYFVSTSLLPVSPSSDIAAAIRFGTTNSGAGLRGIFGANSSFLGVQNLSSVVVTNLTPTVSNNSAVFSARFNLGQGSVTVGKNSTSVQVGGINTTIPSSTINIGGNNNRAITTNFSEILIYKDFHDDATAARVIKHLAKKWSISLL